MTLITEMEWGQNWMGNFFILLKWYKFKLEYYNLGMLNVIPIVNTKKIVIEYIQKEMRI